MGLNIHLTNAALAHMFAMDAKRLIVSASMAADQITLPGAPGTQEFVRETMDELDKARRALEAVDRFYQDYDPPQKGGA